MGSSGSAPDVTREDVRGAFSQLDEPRAPLTAGEVADELGCAERTARHALEGLADRGELRSRRIDDRSRIWWRSANGTESAGELIDENASTDRRAGVVRDGADRKRREQERKWVVRALELAREGISLLDEDGEFVYVNDAYADTFGYEPSEMIGEHWDELGIEAGPEYFYDEILPDITDEGQWTGTTTCVRSDDSTFPVQHSLTHTEEGELICVVRDVSERTERERELERYETIVETVTDGVYTLDADSRFTMVNDAFVDLVGYSREELLGEPASLVHSDAIDAEASRKVEALRTGEREAAVVEVDLRTADGDRVPVESRISPFSDGDGATGRVGVVRDITEQKRREQELRETTEQLEVATRAADVGLWTWDVQENVVTADEFLAETYGTDPEVAAAGAPMEAFYEPIHEDDEDETWDQLMRAVEETGELETEYRVRGADGNVRWVLARGEVSYDDGDPVQLNGAITDITEHKRAEEALHESEERLRLAMDAAEMGVWELDLRTEGSPVRSPQHDRIFGYDEPLDDWSFDTFLDHVHPDDRGRVARSFEEAFETGEWEFECRIVRADDDQRWIAAQGEFYYDDDEPVRAIGTVRDVTEQKEREEYLHDAKAQLEAAAEAGAVGTWEWHIPEDRFVTGASLAKKFGVDPEAARDGVPLDRLVSSIHEADRERVERKLEDAVESCGEYESEYRVRNADGELRWVVARGHVECDEDGNPVTFPGALTDITERKVAQREVEESERRYRTLVENFPNGAVGLFDEDLRYTAAGGQLLDEADVPKEERLGISVYDIYPDELVAEIEPYFTAALDGERNSFEIEYHDRHLHAHTLPVEDDGGEVFAGMLVVQDVTERREAERELRESEAKLRMLAENLAEVVWMATEDAEEFVYVNPAFEEVWGRDRESLYEEPLSFLEAVHPDDRERVRDGFASLPDEEFDDEFRIVRPDGEVRWIHATGARVRDEDGEMVRVVGVGEDVTERVERERELEQSERRYRTLAEHFPNGAVGVYDHDLRYTLTEGAVLGDRLPSADRLEGDRVPEVFPPDTVEDLEPLFRAAVEDGATDSATTEFGGRHWRVWATPLRAADGGIFAGLSFAQDITEQVERERRLEELVDKLETSNERLEQFAYAASHDLQEPLRMVSSYLQLIERRYGDELDDDAEEFIEYAVDGADRMRDMIEGLLEYSRVDARGDPFEPVDLNDVLADVREDLRVRIDESDADIAVESLPRVEGDEGQLRQVFQNLLSNAIEYSGDEPPRIHVSAERHEADEWLVSIRDEGIGIDPGDADRVFEVFQSLHAPADHSGTGIGLALCERIVERHGGDIWVDSEPGYGSTFRFTLPADGETE